MAAGARVDRDARSRAEALVAASRRLCRAVRGLRFGPPVAVVYNPLDYARGAHEEYLRRYGAGRKRVVFVGMNPGPFGMAQTGVPFGDVPTVRDWLRIRVPVGRPPVEHPSRPILGLACPRVEVSGRRLWALMQERFDGPAAFFREHFVANYCPLAFVDAAGRNRTPDRLPAGERERLFAACDRHLAAVARILEPEWLVGVGAFAASRIRLLLQSPEARHVRAAAIPHPSPANPRANADWARAAATALERCGVWTPA